MTAERRVEAPTGLGPKARRLWQDVTSVYALRPDELRLLEDAVREVDIVERLTDALAGSSTASPGSKGQERVSPLFAEVRQHRLVLARLLRQLELPDHDANRARERETARSSRARRAARERWG
jgi:hypothetical protein